LKYFKLVYLLFFKQTNLQTNMAVQSRPRMRQNRPPAVSSSGFPVRNAETKTHLGVRIAEANYRQLKLAAVVGSATIQTLAEQAIDEFLANHPELQYDRQPKSRR
jgi:hypothetical protein